MPDLHQTAITRPALDKERVQCNAAGQVVLKLETPWRDGTTHLVMSPLEFMQRLAKQYGNLHSNKPRTRDPTIPAGKQDYAVILSIQVSPKQSLASVALGSIADFGKLVSCSTTYNAAAFPRKPTKHSTCEQTYQSKGPKT